MQLRITLLLAIVGVLIYNLLFYLNQPTGIGTGLWLIVLHAYFFFTRDKETKNLQLGIASSLIAILFALFASIRGNEVVQMVDLGLASAFSLSAVYFYKQPQKVSLNHLGILILPIITVLESLVSLIMFVTRQESYRSAREDHVTSSLIRGVVIALPIFFVLTLILSSADPVFSKIVGDLLEDIWVRLLVSLFWLATMVGVGISTVKFFIKPAESEMKVGPGKAHELGVILISIVLLFGTFIFVQFKYLFSTVGERELHQLGITSLTYSEYVQKGFFELLIAATVAIFVVLYALRYLHHLSFGQRRSLQYVTSIFIIETMLLLLSAGKRVALYADAHGLTRAREFGFIFLVWLAVILSLLLIRAFVNWRGDQFGRAVIITSLLALFSINIINIDGLSATRFRPTVNNEIDYYYLTGLSVDAYQSWVPAIEDANRVIQELETKDKLNSEDYRKLYWADHSLRHIKAHSEYLKDKFDEQKEINERYKDFDQIPMPVEVIRKWGSFNFADNQAYEYLQKHQITSHITDLRKRVGQLEQKPTDGISPNTKYLDRSINPPFTN